MSDRTLNKVDRAGAMIRTVCCLIAVTLQMMILLHVDVMAMIR
jgi:hypothetical protein